MSPWWRRGRPKEYLAGTMGEIEQQRLRTAGGARPRGAAPDGRFLCIVHVGEPAGGRMVSADLLDRLVQATKQPALEALDRRFGTDAWCPQITTHASLEGPSAGFSLHLVVQPGETPASMSDLVDDEFRRRWVVAVQRLLA
ncbi:hypothetical protein PV458_00185 [Streptomyces sp. MN03-5084-2B]|nr:hypothetical protein [Streptomyces sp. MN03-5084-2B]